MELDKREPLLREHKAQDRATAAAALAGKQHGRDPDAASPSDAKKKLEDVQLAAYSAEKNPSQSTNADDKPAEDKKSEEAPVQAQNNPDPPAPAPKWPRRPRSTTSNNNRNQELAAVNIDKKRLESLTQQARVFAKSAASSSMAATADAFCRAAEHFAAGKDRKKRAMDTELNKVGMALFSIAEGAPSSEAALAAIAVNLTTDAQVILLSDTDSKPGLFAGWWRRVPSPGGTRPSTSAPEAATRPSFKQRLRAAISTPEPMLPIHAEREKKLVDKREVLYALALGAPVAILTSAEGLNLFPGAWAWVAGASVVVWILAASGMVVNQYAELDCERLVARHLGRLGVLVAAVLFCFFTYRAFFPSTSWAVWVLLVIADFALGLPWILSCIRGDDVVSSGSGSAGDAAGRIGKLEMMRREEPPRRRSA